MTVTMNINTSEVKVS